MIMKTVRSQRAFVSWAASGELGAAGTQVAVLDPVAARGHVAPGAPAAVRAVVERPPAIRVTAQLEPVPAAVGLRVPDDEQQPEQAVGQGPGWKGGAEPGQDIR